jgi:hypothetical protein
MIQRDRTRAERPALWAGAAVGQYDRRPGLDVRHGEDHDAGVNNPLVPSPERRNVWWECSRDGCDHVVRAPSQPVAHDRHPTAAMRPLTLPSD